MLLLFVCFFLISFESIFKNISYAEISSITICIAVLHAFSYLRSRCFSFGYTYFTRLRFSQCFLRLYIFYVSVTNVFLLTPEVDKSFFQFIHTFILYLCFLIFYYRKNRRYLYYVFIYKILIYIYIPVLRISVKRHGKLNFDFPG